MTEPNPPLDASEQATVQWVIEIRVAAGDTEAHARDVAVEMVLRCRGDRVMGII